MSRALRRSEQSLGWLGRLPLGELSHERSRWQTRSAGKLCRC
jgi:hypothetical protein